MANNNTLSFSEIEQLWINQGGNPQWAATMAGISEAESGGNSTAINNDPSTGDYSVGLWQVNYRGHGPGQYSSDPTQWPLYNSRVQQYGAPSDLQGNPASQADAAISLLGTGSGITNWQGDAVGNVAIQSGDKPLSDSEIQSILNGLGKGSINVSQADSVGSGNSPGQQDANTKLTGAAGILQTIDGLLNPQGPGLVQNATSLGTAGIATAVQKIVVRGLFTVGFMGLTYLGVKTVTGTGGSSTNVILQAGQYRNRRRSLDIQQQNANTNTAREFRQARRVAEVA